MRILFLICALIFIFEQAMADDNSSPPADKEKKEERKIEKKSRSRYLWLGMGLSIVKVIDNATSPLLYKGVEFPYVSLGFMAHSDKKIRIFEIDYSSGSLKSRTETDWEDLRINSYYIVLRFNKLYRVRPIWKDRINWYLGPEANGNIHVRYNPKFENSSVNYDTYFGLGISNRFELPLQTKKRRLRFSWQLSMPIVGFIIRPSYVTIPHYFDSNIMATLTTKGGFFVPFNIRSQLEFYYELRNQNMFKLSYIWNFMNHNPGYNKVQSAFHGIQFSFIYKLNYHKKEQ